MASGIIYGAFSGVAITNLRPAIEWSSSPSTANNNSSVTASLVFYRYNTSWQSYNNNGRDMTIDINGNSATANRPFDLRGKSKVVIWTRTVPVTHNSDGKKSITIKASGSTGISLGTFNFSGTAKLDDIPRESKITSFTTSGVTGVQFTFNFAVDKEIDSSQYSLNGGGWTSFSGSGLTITGRTPGTKYTIKIRVRNKASGLWTESNTLTINTVRLSTYTVPSRNTGQSITVEISRGSSSMTHDVTLQFLQSNGNWQNWITKTNQGAICVFEPTEAQLNTLYNARPDTSKPSIRVSVVNKWNNGTNQGTNVSGQAILTIVDANPSIASVSYADINGTVQAFLDNNQKILKDKSNLRVIAGLAKSQKGATLKSYTVSIGGKSYTANAGNNLTTEDGKIINIGTIAANSNQTASITITDSRGYTATRSFTVQVLNYEAPQLVFASADRLNNYEEPTTLNINARRSVVKPGSFDVNEAKIYYRVKENPSGEYGSWILCSHTDTLISGLWQSFEVSKYMDDYPNDKTYTVEVSIEDNFTSWKSDIITVTKGIALLQFMQDKINAGVPLHDKESQGRYMFFADYEEV